MENVLKRRYIKISKVCEILDCSEPFVWELLRNGYLKGIKIGVRTTRILPSSLEEFIKRCEINPDLL